MENTKDLRRLFEEVLTKYEEAEECTIQNMSGEIEKEVEDLRLEVEEYRNKFNDILDETHTDCVYRYDDNVKVLDYTKFNFKPSPEEMIDFTWETVKKDSKEFDKKFKETEERIAESRKRMDEKHKQFTKQKEETTSRMNNIRQERERYK